MFHWGLFNGFSSQKINETKIKLAAMRFCVCLSWFKEIEGFHSVQRSRVPTSWEYDMFKCCQYATNDCKVYVGLITISIKVTSILQKTITWTKKNGKGRRKWHKTCLHSGVPLRKLKTPIKIRFASTIVLFQKILEFKHTIAL
jgi:hypothetical protein